MADKFEVVTEMQFDKQDVVTVALAKIEANIRKEVRASKERVRELELAIEKTEAQLDDMALKAAPKQLLKKEAALNKAFKGLYLGKTIVAKVESSPNKHDEENNNKLVIQSLDDKGKPTRGIVVMVQSSNFSSGQKRAYQLIEKYKTQRQEAADRGVEWKSKLHDMPAAERQMRAVVVEHELNKTAKGKALVDLLTKNYEETIKLISM